MKEEESATAAVAGDADLPLVLIIDDNANNLELAQLMLSGNGFRAAGALGGAAGLKAAREQGPDVILLDVLMPEMDGFETCRRLKDDPATADIPVIFLTGAAEDDYIVAGFRSGGVDFVSKPFRTDEFLARVRTHIELVRQRRELVKQTRQTEDANAQLEVSNRELRDLTEVKATFLRTAAHDLRKPLELIQQVAARLFSGEEVTGDTPPLRPGELSGRRRLSELSATERDLHTIHECAGYMSKIISDLLEAEASEGKDVDLRREATDLAELAGRAIEFNALGALHKKIQITPNLEEGCVALVDANRVLEAMENLVSNAIKFSPPEREVRVSVRPAEENGRREFRFSVSDQGPGLTSDDHKAVFTKFRTLSARPTGGESSTGVGLSIVKHLVELHNGRVWVRSEHGQGATFTFALPSPVEGE